MVTPTNIAQNLQLIRENIANIAHQSQRDPTAITLIAVSKTRSIAEIIAAINCDQKNFGENRLQEALPKIAALKKYNLIWHYIGRIQSNKAKLIAQNFDWVQSVARAEIAELLNQYRPKNLPPLKICIQVNLDVEASKDGITLEQIAPLAKVITQLPQLKLQGLMAIPAPGKDCVTQLQTFKKLAAWTQPGWDLSMGMSDDYRAAIIAGATMIRIGTAIFGERNYS